MKIEKEKITQKIKDLAKETKKKSIDMVDSSKQMFTNQKALLVKTLDANQDGTIDIEDIIVLSLKTPGIGITRKEFLEKEFSLKHTKEQIEEIINTTPFQAGISLEEINKIAKNVIQLERNCVTGISTVLGTPGGLSMVATLPADIIQYYGCMLRAAQKLMYLYGFPEIDIQEKGKTFDTETLNMLIISLGVMYGVAGANNAIKAMAKALAVGVEKKLMRTALTKGTIYPIVKNIAKWFGVKMTKEVFAGFFKKAIPVVGGMIGGGITYLSFKPCCDTLQKTLQDTLLSNPYHVETQEEKMLFDAINGKEETDKENN